MRLFLIRFLTKRLLKVVTADDVLRLVNKDLYLGKSKLTDSEIGMLKSEAQDFSNSLLWHYLKLNLQYLATMKIGRNAQSKEDIAFGLAMFHNLDVTETFIEKLSTL